MPAVRSDSTIISCTDLVVAVTTTVRIVIRSQFAIIRHPLGESQTSYKLSGPVIRLNYIWVIITNLENGCCCSNNNNDL